MNRIMKISFLTFILMMAVGMVFAQGRGRGMGRGAPAWDDEMGNRPERIEFTSEQKSKFIEIGADLAEKQIPIHARIDQLNLQLDELQNSKDLDEKKLRSLMSAKGELRAELQINHMKAENKARALLTSEQLEKLGDRPVPFM
ncbi:hypothetical protein K8I28_03130, partial [bacterium]|nr:hypothetical protein [bacterium]